MTYRDLVKSVARESKTGANRSQVDQILMTAIRCIIEELLADKGNSEVSISNFLTLYLYPNKRRGGGSQVVDAWCLGMRRPIAFKQLINDKVELRDYVVACRWLYPELHEKKSTYHRQKIEYVDTRCGTGTINLYQNERFMKKEEAKKIERQKRKEAKNKNYTTLLPEDDV